MSESKIRLAKFIAQSGHCSRRDAEKLIEQGKVQVDSKVIKDVVTFVNNDNKVVIGKKVLQKNTEVKVWLYYKPLGLVTTHKDPEGRPTVFEDVGTRLDGHVISVGRLDLNSEGLLILTNSGPLSRYLEKPDSGFERSYLVRVFGDVSQEKLDRLSHGVTIGGVHYGKIIVERSDRPKRGLNQWLTVKLYEGKNREIRRVMEHLGLQVNRLKRLSYGPFDLGGLKPRELKEVSLPQKIAKMV